ncbi:MAG: nucleoside-diphosphate kinase, partial [Acidimicrobiia bacterium]|nr:nucleoside-diphosphate kinase [Acidimicrobiia bacterium]
MNRTFIICKPDAVERGYVGEILDRFERKGLKLVAGELRQLDDATLAQHYAEHTEKP